MKNVSKSIILEKTSFPTYLVFVSTLTNAFLKERFWKAMKEMKALKLRERVKFNIYWKYLFKNSLEIIFQWRLFWERHAKNSWHKPWIFFWLMQWLLTLDVTQVCQQLLMKNRFLHKGYANSDGKQFRACLLRSSNFTLHVKRNFWNLISYYKKIFRIKTLCDHPEWSFYCAKKVSINFKWIVFITRKLNFSKQKNLFIWKCWRLPLMEFFLDHKEFPIFESLFQPNIRLKSVGINCRALKNQDLFFYLNWFVWTVSLARSKSKWFR